MNKNFQLNHPGEIDIDDKSFDIHNDYYLQDINLNFSDRMLTINFNSIDDQSEEKLYFEARNFEELTISTRNDGYTIEDDITLDAIGYLFPETDAAENGFLLEDMIEGERHIIFLFESRWFIRFGAENITFVRQPPGQHPGHRHETQTEQEGPL